MSSFLRRCLVCLLLAALPWQAASAAAAWPAVAPSMPMHAQADGAAPCHRAGHTERAGHHAPRCADCAACCACAAPPPALLLAFDAPSTSRLGATRRLRATSFVTDGPLRPPRAVR